jgi:hypothetical protein
MWQIILVGVGGFTTFSTFGCETMALLRDKEMLNALLYVGLHLSLGFGAVALGYGLSTWKGGTMLPKEEQLLRIFIGESDRHEGRPLCAWIVRKARGHHMAGGFLDLVDAAVPKGIATLEDIEVHFDRAGRAGASPQLERDG